MKGRHLVVTTLLLLVLSASLFFVGLDSMPLTDRDEGEYAASVMAMAQSGDWVVPTLNGRHYLEKPIGVFWAIGAAQSLLGPGEEAARLPSAVSGFLLVLCAGGLVLVATRALPFAVLAAAACGFTPLMLLVGRACLTDALLALFTTVALGGFFLATESPPARSRWWYLIAWAGLALGFLTKGPVAPAVVLPTAVIYALWQRRLLPVLKEARIHWGILIFLLVNLPWYGLAFYRLGGEFWRAFFVSQNLRRFSEVLLGHGGGWFYYLPVLLMGCFPFAAAALPALGRALFKNPAPARAADPAARLRLLSAIAVLVVLLVFSLAATKQINYILPALPFLGILAGYFLWRLGAGEPAGRVAGPVFKTTLYGTGGIWCLVMLAVPVAVPLAWKAIEASIRFDSSEYALPLQPPVLVLWPLACALLIAGTLVAARLLMRRGRAPWVGPVLGLGGALFGAALMLGLLPQAAGIIQQPARRMVQQVAQRAGPHSELVTYGLWKPSLIFYAGRDLPRFRVEDTGRLAEALKSERPVFVLTRVRLKDKLARVPGFVPLASYQGYLAGGNRGAAGLWSPPEGAEGGS